MLGYYRIDKVQYFALRGIFMHYIIILSMFFLIGCHHHASILKKTQIFMDYHKEQGQKFANSEYSFQECTQNFKKKYAELFGNQKLDLSKYNTKALKELWKVYDIMSFHSLEQKYLFQVENILENLEKRNVTRKNRIEYSYKSTYVEDLFSLYIKFADFSKAKQLKEKYPNILKLEPVLDIYEDNLVLQKHYKLYKISPDGKSIKLTSIQMGKDPKIIAILNPNCHFAKLAMETISSTPDLRSIFENHALIIFPLNTSMSYVMEIAKWNGNNPKLEYFIYLDRKDLREDWSDLDFTKGVCFYFLKDKQIIYQLGGWGPTEKEFKETLRKGIDQIGISTIYSRN